MSAHVSDKDELVRHRHWLVVQLALYLVSEVLDVQLGKDPGQFTPIHQKVISIFNPIKPEVWNRCYFNQ